MRSRLIVWFMAGASAALAQFTPKEFFVPQRQYRFCPDGGNPVPSGQRRLEAIEDYGKYHLGFIEFKDDGSPWDACQAKAVLNLIEQQRGRSGRPVSVLLFIHGWKNHANVVDEGQKGQDVEKFRYFVERWANEYQDGKAWPVIGVYVGWRGRSMNAPGFVSWVTFWRRSVKARSSGDGKMGDVVDNIIQAAEKNKNRDLGASKVLLLGHSFGSRVLETAVANDKKKTILNGQCKVLAWGENVGTNVGGTFFLNAATSSIFMRRVMKKCQPKGENMLRAPDWDQDFCRANPAHRRCQPYPMMISITSKGDWATRGFLFLAAFQRPFALLPWRRTHSVDREALNTPIRPNSRDVFAFDSFRGDQPATYIVRRKQDTKANNPVWAMTVDRTIARNHGDIWNDDMFAMIRGLMATLDEKEAEALKHYDPGSQRMRQTTPAKP